MTWNMCDSREDGSILESWEIYGYNVYESAADGEWTHPVQGTELVLWLPPGEYAFSVDCVDINGLSSQRTSSIQMVIGEDL